VAVLCLYSFLYYGCALRLGRCWEGGSWRVTAEERWKEGTRMYVCVCGCVCVCMYVRLLAAKQVQKHSDQMIMLRSR
jgi:hypothetical protein